MRVRRFVAVAVAGLLASSALVACSSTKNGSGTNNASGVLNVGAPNGPQTENHNPFLPTSASSSLGYRYMMYEPLVMLNPVRPADAGTPLLATKWDWSENYNKLVLTMRDNVKWSDRQALSAQ